ncbi:lineage-specific thermal regulator protein [Fictibacillus macauensis ZFHKF-1]|uniref:Lineage-specific thermal regulator protein n=1 Tax=Fictibacillus macauensis ZFHKF-1 TaxID=1196324 RepID=I8UBR8_9BACL|nr:PadR family transcriptional regulator [Fictibacillus macauensis]EIT84390.1 lineage-specific thermal regulator protein [Fictibacillus macauensis ZFHKF-1]
MEERLRQLQKKMNQSTFASLSFTNQHRKNIIEKIKHEQEREEDVLLALMQLLQTRQTGFELAQNMRRRGFLTYENNEGALYVVLHRLEREGCIVANWTEDGGKYYELAKKGRKALRNDATLQGIFHVVIER